MFNAGRGLLHSALSSCKQDAEEDDDVKRLKLSSFWPPPLQAASSSLMGQLTNDKSMGGPSFTIQYYVEEERRVPLTQNLFLL